MEVFIKQKGRTLMLKPVYLLYILGQIVTSIFFFFLTIKDALKEQELQATEQKRLQTRDSQASD